MEFLFERSSVEKLTEITVLAIVWKSVPQVRLLKVALQLQMPLRNDRTFTRWGPHGRSYVTGVHHNGGLWESICFLLSVHILAAIVEQLDCLMHSPP